MLVAIVDPHASRSHVIELIVLIFFECAVPTSMFRYKCLPKLSSHIEVRHKFSF